MRAAAAKYHRNAAECLRLTWLAQSVEELSILSEIAQTWTALAEQAEQLEQLKCRQVEALSRNKSRRMR